jgi:hypothetical protein
LAGDPTCHVSGFVRIAEDRWRALDEALIEGLVRGSSTSGAAAWRMRRPTATTQPRLRLRPFHRLATDVDFRDGRDFVRAFTQPCDGLREHAGRYGESDQFLNVRIETGEDVS